MNKFQIHIDTSSLQKSRSGQITGVLCIDVEGRFFPEKGWNDFVVIVLEWWLEKLETLKINGEADFLFMDGPFSFSLYRSIGNAYTVSYSNDPKNLTKIDSILYLDLAQSIYSSCESILKTCEEKGWCTMEVELLKRIQKRSEINGQNWLN